MSQAPLEPGILSLAGLVDYQEGSIVSRTLPGKPTGNVTLFAFDQGQGLSPHTSPFDALALAVEGEAEVTIMEERYSLAPGEVLFLPANQPHAVLAPQRCKVLLMMIRS